MMHPQTKAEQLAAHKDKIPVIAKNACLAMCYLYCCGLSGTELDYIINCARAMDEGLLNSECWVKDANEFIKAFTGRKVTVVKKQIDNIKTIKEPTPIRYEYNGKGHWVVIQNGKIVFNSLLNSNCVNKGAPAKNPKDPNARVIKLV